MTFWERTVPKLGSAGDELSTICGQTHKPLISCSFQLRSRPVRNGPRPSISAFQRFDRLNACFSHHVGRASQLAIPESRPGKVAPLQFQFSAFQISAFPKRAGTALPLSQSKHPRQRQANFSFQLFSISAFPQKVPGLVAKGPWSTRKRFSPLAREGDKLISAFSFQISAFEKQLSAFQNG